MEPISDMSAGVKYPLSTVAGVKEPPNAPQPQDKTRDNSIAPAKDTYIPRERQEPTGLYRLGKDEKGQPKVYFDDPNRAANVPERQTKLPGAEGPNRDKDADAPADGPDKKASGEKAQSCTGSTDQVDGEIEKLKKKQEELERQINSETDATKIKELKRKLAQVESELGQKDNDTYRRQHSTFS